VFGGISGLTRTTEITFSFSTMHAHADSMQISADLLLSLRGATVESDVATQEDK
jgi:hypothetical protein